MKISNIGGVIRRRILVNYRIVPELLQPLLPAKFRPKLHNGFAIGGICLIRLEHIRPKGTPEFLGLNSENAAHRVAVVWEDEPGKLQEGVYIWQRHTDSRLNQIAGGRIFPGEHQPAIFDVKNDGERIDFKMTARDGKADIQVKGVQTEKLPSLSGFKNISEASDFFEPGSLGYSATKSKNRLEGLRLKTATWKVAPFQVEQVHSSFFDDREKFPTDMISFDCALLMRDIQHEWKSETDLHL